MHPLCIHCVLIHTLCPSNICTVWFHPRKKFWTAQNILNGWTLRHYYDNLQHIRATNGLCPLSFVESLRYPFCLLLISSQLTPVASENGEREERYGTWTVYTSLVARTLKDVSVCISFVCLFVCGFSSHSRIVHSYRDVTLDSEEAEKFDICSALKAIEQ